MRWRWDTELETGVGVGTGTELEIEIEIEIEKQKKKKNRGGDGDGDGDWGNLCIKIIEVIIGIKGGIIAITIMTTIMIMTMTDYEYVGLFLSLGCVNE